MVGRTLTDLRNEIASLSTPDGAFRVVCARTGERPVPSADLRFPNRETAAEAAVLTEQYRAALRRYDPRLPRHEPIVSEAPAGLTHGSGDFDDPTRIEFCHRVVAAVFETLVADGYRGVETAVMDAYLARAERVADRDRLCLALLRCVADEMTERLTPTEQAGVLRGAAARLPAPADPDADPLPAALSTLETASLLGGFAVEDGLVVGDYALDATGGRLPTLPIAVAVFRRRPGEQFGIADAARCSEGWHLSLSTVERGLASAPISES